jgi:acetyl esterase
MPSTPPSPADAEPGPDLTILDADTRAMLIQLTNDPFLDPGMSPAEMRAAFERFYGALYEDFADLTDREDRVIPGRQGAIPIRIYRPRETAGDALLPALVFMHGGGSIMGSLDSYDAVCQTLCHQSDCAVVSVDYRLAPEHPFSAAVDDCADAVVWTHANAAELRFDAGRLAVGGESGGAGLAAIVTQIARAEGGPPLAFQLLIYPYVGTRGPTASMKTFAKGYFFDAETLDVFIALNFKDPAQLRDWRVAPVWSDSFADLPPAFVVSAGADILRDDVEDYAARLAGAGVQTELKRYEGTIHGFVCMFAKIELGRKALFDCAERLREALGRQR